jgi:hypothetical protein
VLLLMDVMTWCFGYSGGGAGGPGGGGAVVDGFLHSVPWYLEEGGGGLDELERHQLESALLCWLGGFECGF